jgi:hypothetical protein
MVEDNMASKSTASVNWVDNAIHLRVYSTDGATVTERCWDGKGWTTGGFKQAGEAVSATCWTTGGLGIRVYCTKGGVTTEYCWDKNGPWYKGAYTG